MSSGESGRQTVGTGKEEVYLDHEKTDGLSDVVVVSPTYVLGVVVIRWSLPRYKEHPDPDGKVSFLSIFPSWTFSPRRCNHWTGFFRETGTSKLYLSGE